MRLIIAGSRHLELELAQLDQAVVATGLVVTEVVSGACRGVDMLGEQWAVARGIPVARFPPDWSRWGRAAGPIRNDRMLAYAVAGPAGSAGGALLALWDGVSRGTAHIIRSAQARGLMVHVHRVAGVPCRGLTASALTGHSRSKTWLA